MSTLLRKFLASASIAALVSTLMVSTALAATFNDVAEGDVWFDAVEQGVADGVFSVSSDGNFGPFDGVNRAEMAMVTIKAAGIDLMEAPEAPTPDMPLTDPAVDYVYTGMQNGLWKGYENGMFGGEDLLTRAQSMIILQNAFGFEKPDTCTAEMPDVPTDHYGYDAMEAMWCWSVINGYENGNFGPNDTLVRYQVAIMVNSAKYNYEERVVGGEGEGEGEVVSSGEVTITEGDNMPESMTVPKNASSVAFMEFALTAGDEEADIDGITFVRQGVGSTSDFDNVYLYEGNTRLTSGRSVSSDDNTAEFSSLGWNLAPGESRTFTLRADINSNAVPANEHRFYIYEMEGATAGGEVNLAGPYMSIGGASAGTVDVEKNGTLTNPSLGADGAKISQFKLSASTEDVTVMWINVYVTGTISKNELSNFRLYKGTTVSDDNLVAEADEIGLQDTVDFDLGDGIEIEDGDEQIFVMTADIDGDSGDQIDTYIDEVTDIYAVGDVFGTGSRVSINTNFDAAADSRITLQGGEVTLSFNGPAATDVPVDSKKVTFLDFSLTADRDIEVKQLEVIVADQDSEQDGTGSCGDVASAAGDLIDTTGTTEANYTNIRVMEGDKNLMETESLSTGGNDCSQTLTFTDSFYVDKGETKDMSIKMDIDDSAQTDEVRVTLSAISTSAGIKDVATNKFLSDIVPSSALVGNTMAVVDSTLTLTRAATPVADVFVKGTKNVPVTGFLFRSGTADMVRVTGITLTGYIDDDYNDVTDGDPNTSPAATAGVDAGNDVEVKDIVNNVRLYENGYAADKTPVAGPEGVETTTGEVVFDNMEYDIPASTTVRLVAVADVSTNAFQNSNGEAVSFGIAAASNVTAEDSDGDSVDPAYGTPSANNGTTTPVSFVGIAQAGTLTVSTKNSTTPSANIVIAGRTGVEVARYEWNATIEDITVNDVDLGFAGTSGSDEVKSVSLYDADDLTTALATGFIENGTVDFNDLGFVVPADDSAVMVVTVDLNDIPSGADSGDAFVVGIKTVQEAQGAAGTDVTVTEETDISSCNMTVTLTNSSDTTAAIGTSGGCSQVSNGDIVALDAAANGIDEYVLVKDVDSENDGTDDLWEIVRGVFGSTATSVDYSGGVNLNTGGSALAAASGNIMVVRETKPTFTSVLYPSSTKLTNGSGKGIYKFTVDAEAEEDIDLSRLVFEVTGQFNGFSLASNGSTSSLDPYDKNGLQSTSGTGLYTDDNVDDGSELIKNVSGVTLYDVTDGEDVDNITITFVNDNSGTGYIVLDFDNSEEVSSTGKTYELRANIAGVKANGDFLSVNILDIADSTNQDGVIITDVPGTVKVSTNLTDTTFAGDATDATVLDDVVWSDESSTSHNNGTADFTNGYLLKSLKTVAQTLTFTTS